MPQHMRLKILAISFWYPSAENPAEGQFIREMNRAVSIYNDVVAICIDDVPARAGLFEVSDTIDENIRTIRFRFRKVKFITAIMKYFVLWWFLRQFIAVEYKPDVIHAHVYNAGALAVFTGRKTNIPVIVTEHLSSYAKGTVAGIRKKMARYALQNADKVLAVSDFLRDSIQECGIDANFEVVPNVIDTNLFTPKGKDSA